MATGAFTQPTVAGAIARRQLFAGACAIGAGVIGLLYAVAFVVLQNQLLYGLFLMLSGILTIVVMTALYEQLHTAGSLAALLGLILSMVGALGALAHGGYDLANAINPPTMPGAQDLPFAVDPRGLLTFGMAGLGVFAYACLLQRTGARALSGLAFVLGVLLVMIYVARLTVLSPANPILLIPVLLAGFVVNPAWLFWLAVRFLRGQ